MEGNLRNKRVLVVEDEFFLADDLKEALEKAGAEVLGPVATGAEAAALLRTQNIDLAVIDINLRGEASFAIPDGLTEKGIPFVFATGYDATIIPERFADVPRWEKPYRLREVVDVLQGLKPPDPPRSADSAGYHPRDRRADQ